MQATGDGEGEESEATADLKSAISPDQQASSNLATGDHKGERQAPSGTIDTNAYRASASTDAEKFVQRWVDAQNNCDFVEYEALYAPDFRGVKRTTTGKAYEWEREKWMKNARELFQDQEGTLRVEAKDIRHAGDSGEGEGIEFEQHYRSRNYADYGPKLMILRRTANGFQILYEELKEAHPAKLEARMTNGYACPDSDKRLLTHTDLDGRTLDELRLMRNELFARHGKVYTDPSLAEHFRKQSWYRENPALKEPYLSSVEDRNAAFILKYEKSGGRSR